MHAVDNMRTYHYVRIEMTNYPLQAMRGAEAGLYCAPLRLLAMEVADACNADGTFCTLITGVFFIFCKKVTSPCMEVADAYDADGTFCTLITDALSKPPTLLSRGPCPCGIGRIATARFCAKPCFVSLCKHQGPYHGRPPVAAVPHKRVCSLGDLCDTQVADGCASQGRCRSTLYFLAAVQDRKLVPGAGHMDMYTRGINRPLPSQRAPTVLCALFCRPGAEGGARGRTYGVHHRDGQPGQPHRRRRYRRDPGAATSDLCRS